MPQADPPTRLSWWWLDVVRACRDRLPPPLARRCPTEASALRFGEPGGAGGRAVTAVASTRGLVAESTDPSAGLGGGAGVDPFDGVSAQQLFDECFECPTLRSVERIEDPIDGGGAAR